jgi:hypothetical protein
MKMYDGFDSLRAAQRYLNLPVLPGPIFADENEEESQNATAGRQPPAEPRVEVQLIHQRDFDAMKAAQAAAAEKHKNERRPAAKAARTKRRKRPRPSRAVAGARDPHERHCTVCNSPDRDAIEEEFVHWHNPTDIAFHHKVGYHCIYRHARARKLVAARERNMRFALGNIIQKSLNVKPTADAVIRAIRAYSCLNRDGQWIEPPAHVIVSSGSRIPSPAAIAIAAAADPAELPAPDAQTLQLPASADRVASDATR